MKERQRAKPPNIANKYGLNEEQLRNTLGEFQEIFDGACDEDKLFWRGKSDEVTDNRRKKRKTSLTNGTLKRRTIKST